MNPKTSFPSILAIGFAMLFLASTPSVPRAQCGGCETEGGIEPGAWALQFRVADFFTLGSFQGAVVSAKYHLSKSRAIRLGVSGSLTSDNGDGHSHETLADSVTFDGASSDKGRRRSVGLNAQYLHYYSPQGRMNAFVGAGPLLDYDWNSDYNHSPRWGDQETHGHGWTMGVSALIGAEWFAARSISFHAEYGLALTRSWSSTEEVDTTYSPLRVSRDKSSDHRWSIGASNVQLGLSVYL